jgi:epoxyqueuosine reductase QueG
MFRQCIRDMVNNECCEKTEAAEDTHYYACGPCHKLCPSALGRFDRNSTKKGYFFDRRPLRFLRFYH